MLVTGAGPALAHEYSLTTGGGSCDIKPDNSSCAGATDSGNPGSASSLNLSSDKVGNPINLMTGIKSQKETDFTIPGAALTFNRLYSSHTGGANINE